MIFRDEALIFERALDDHVEVAGVKRLLQEIEGAAFHGFDGGFDRAVGGHDDDGAVGIVRADARKDLHAGDVGHLEIGENDVVVFLFGTRYAGVAAVFGFDIVAFS